MNNPFGLQSHCEIDCSVTKGDIAVRRGFSLIGSGVEDQISEITLFKFLLHIPVTRCLNHSRKENFCFWLIIVDNCPVYPTPKIMFKTT